MSFMNLEGWSKGPEMSFLKKMSGLSWDLTVYKIFSALSGAFSIHWIFQNYIFHVIFIDKRYKYIYIKYRH